MAIHCYRARVGCKQKLAHEIARDTTPSKKCDGSKKTVERRALIKCTKQCVLAVLRKAAIGGIATAVHSVCSDWSLYTFQACESTHTSNTQYVRRSILSSPPLHMYSGTPGCSYFSNDCSSFMPNALVHVLATRWHSNDVTPY